MTPTEKELRTAIQVIDRWRLALEGSEAERVERFDQLVVSELGSACGDFGEFLLYCAGKILE